MSDEKKVLLGDAIGRFVRVGSDVVSENLQHGLDAAERLARGKMPIAPGEGEATAARAREDIERLANAVGQLVEMSILAGVKFAEGFTRQLRPSTGADEPEPSGASAPRSRGADASEATTIRDLGEAMFDLVGSASGVLVEGISRLRAQVEPLAERTRESSADEPRRDPEILLEGSRGQATGSFQVRNRGGMVARIQLRTDGLVGPLGTLIPGSEVRFDPALLTLPPRMTATIRIAVALRGHDYPCGSYVGEVHSEGEGSQRLRRRLRLTIPEQER
jgi:hypothetical protein